MAIDRLAIASYTVLTIVIGTAVAQNTQTVDSERSIIELRAQPEYVAIFKNGMALVSSSTKLPAKGGRYRLRPLPEATYGSLWFSWSTEQPVTNILATEAEASEKKPAVNLFEILRANTGGTVELLIEKTWQKVDIIDVPLRDQPPVMPMPEVYPTIIPPLPPRWGELVIVEDSQGTRAVPLHRIEEIRLAEGQPNYLLPEPIPEAVVEFDAAVAEGNSSSIFSMTYLARGLAWSPSYIVDISNPDAAIMTGQAIIVNDLLPLHNSRVELVTGYPHLAFDNLPNMFSPIPLATLLARVEQHDLMGSSKGSPMLRQTMAMEAANSFALPPPPTTPVTGESTEDLFFYNLTDVDLDKGQRGYFPLFQEAVPYQHLYTWDVQQEPGTDYMYRRGGASDPQITQVVWHALKLLNSTNQPWTTAAAVTVKNGRVLGQDTIAYTPPEAEVDLRITQAVGIRAEHQQYETGRAPNAARFYGQPYDRITVTGELTVTNFQDQPVTLKITRTISGEMVDAEGDPEITKPIKVVSEVNPTSRLIWTITVQPGIEHRTTLKYVYELFVRG